MIIRTNFSAMMVWSIYQALMIWAHREGRTFEDKVQELCDDLRALKNENIKTVG